MAGRGAGVQGDLLGAGGVGGAISGSGNSDADRIASGPMSRMLPGRAGERLATDRRPDSHGSAAHPARAAATRRRGVLLSNGDGLAYVIAGYALTWW